MTTRQCRAALRALTLAAAMAALSPADARAQESGAAALADALAGLSVNARVLMIGAHPDDEDTRLLTYLARGRHVKTAYLSLTRGDGGQNLIGNELGEGLGVIRTEELLAARRIDAAHQYFTRAYDFGFSKTAAETFKHWPRDSVLQDVVAVVRSFRPHVIVAVFSGTPADGHGHHQASGILAREAFDAAADAGRFPPARVGGLQPWTTLKLYHTLRGNVANATVTFNVGEYSALFGRSYGEMSGESRSQHRSQGFGALEPLGAALGGARLERSAVGAIPQTETSLFDGIDTTWNRFRTSVNSAPLLDSLRTSIAAARNGFSPFSPAAVLPPLGRIQALLRRVAVTDTGLSAEFSSARDELNGRLRNAINIAAGVAAETTIQRELLAADAPVPVAVSLYNRGRIPLTVLSRTIQFARAAQGGDTWRGSATVAPDSVFTETLTIADPQTITRPWWLVSQRNGGMFTVPIVDGARVVAEDQRPTAGTLTVSYEAAGATSEIVAPVSFRFRDAVLGELQRPAVVAPALSITLDRDVEYVSAGAEYDRRLIVRLVSADARPRETTVMLQLPRGLTADSASRRVMIPAHGTASMSFMVRGSLVAGSHEISATAASNGETFSEGYSLIEYPHIRSQRVYAAARLRVTSTPMLIPGKLRVAYVPGAGDNVAPVLQQMGVHLTVVRASEIASVDLVQYTTVVIGPRAYDANPDLLASNTKLFAWVRAGGTMLVQYGQNMNRPGLMPFAVGTAGNRERVTEEDALVRILAPGSPLLNAPNRITTADFDGWVQERATYMPVQRDSAYKPLLLMGDSGEQPLDGGLLVAQMEKGTYIYCALALFRQIPAGVPGAARIMVNLMSAGAAQ